MKLEALIAELEVVKVVGNLHQDVLALEFDSRKVDKGSAFFAIVGATNDGHDFLTKVIEAGCTVLFVEREIDAPKTVTVVQVKNTAEALGKCAASFFGHPSRELKMVGVTGTNGKTTTSTLLFELFKSLGYHCGLLSTVENRIGTKVIPATHTTPNPVALNALLREMVDEGCEYCFMEVSSHAVHQHRIAGLDFNVGVFTNISHDHLDYHKTFKEYIEVKKAFFDGLGKQAVAISNVDDKNGAVMLQNTKAKTVSYALKSPADHKAKVLENQLSGLVLLIDGKEVWTRLIGDFNAYNVLAVYCVALALDQQQDEVLQVLSSLHSVEGRFQYFISEGGVTAIIDYAHTPDALENVLKTIGNIRTKNEQVITVVGCGGDRDKTKRPEMAAIACEMSDKVVFTSDNPRSEDPNAILEDMQEGVPGQHYKKTLSIVDRKQAIKTALAMAEPKDIILIAGKGHEKYQEIKGVKYDFDDMQITKELIKQLEK